jgi:hypothetical protein
MVFEFKWLHSEENFDENDSTSCGNSRKFQCNSTVKLRVEKNGFGKVIRNTFGTYKTQK